MNKILKKGKIFFIILLLLIFVGVKRVCGVGFEFTVDEEIINNKSYYTFFTYVASSEYSKNSYRQEISKNNISYGDAIKNEIYITPIPENGNTYSGSSDHYDVSGIMIHPLAINSNGNGPAGLRSATSYYPTKDDVYYFNISYDNIRSGASFNYSNTNDYMNNDKVEKKSVYIKPDESSNAMNGAIVLNIDNYTSNLNANGLFFTKYTLINDGEIVKYKYYIEKNFIDKTIINHNKNYSYPKFIGNNGGSYDYYYCFVDNNDYDAKKIRVSLVLSTTYPDGKLHKMFTSAQFFYNMYVRSGAGFGEGSKGFSGLGKSAANDMDNDLRILNEESSTKVSVGHVIRNENGTTTPITDGVSETLKTERGNVSIFDEEANMRVYTFGDGKNEYPDEKKVTVINSTHNSSVKVDGITYKYTGYEVKSADNSSSRNIGEGKEVEVGLPKTGAIEGAKVIFFYEKDDSRNIYIGYYDESGKPLDFARKEERYNDCINLFHNKSKFEEKYITFQNFTVKDTTTSHDGYVLKEIRYKSGRNISAVIPKYNGVNYSFDGFNNSSNSQEFTVPKGNNYYYVAFIYKKGEVKQPKLFYSYVGVELDEKNGGYKFVEKLKGPYEEDNNGGYIYISTKDEKFNGYDPNPLGCVSRLDGEIGTVYEDLFYEDIVNTKLYPVNKEKGINFEGVKHKDNNSLIVVLYLKYKPITYNLFVYRRAIDENKKIQNENLKIGINPEGNKVTASIGTVESIAKKECRKYTITLEDDRKKTTVNLKNILKSDMSEDQIIEYKFAGKWSNIKQSDTSKLKDYDSNNGINYHLKKTLTSRNFYLWLYYNEDKPKTVTICPILSFEAANSAFKTTPYAECDDSDGKYNSECDPSKIETIYIPAGEDVTTKIANVPKIMFLNYNDADSYGRRGGIWQKLEKSWVEINNDILNQYKKAAGIENSKNFGAKELYQKYKGSTNSITKDEIVQEKNGKYYVMKYKYTIIGHSLLYMDKIYVDSSNNNISSENQIYKLSEIKGTSVYKKMEEYYAKTSYAVLSQKNNIFGYDKIYTNKVISELNKMKDNLYTENIKIPDNAPNGVNVASARINYVTSRSGITVFNKNSSISKYLWVDGDSGSDTIINVPINKKISELYRNTNTSKAGINVLVPANISSVKVEAAGQVNHSDDKDISNAIQNHSNLTVTANMGTPANVYTNITSLKEELLKKKIRSYIKSYVYIFDFNVQRLDGGKPTGEPTKIIKSNSNQISVYVNDDSVENNKNGSAVKDYVNNITVLAFTKNTPDDYIENSIQIAMKTTTNENWENITYHQEIYSIQNCSKKTTNNIWSKTLVDRNEEISQDAYYVVKASKTVASIGRIYDFRITDCTDVDFKSVFRKSGQGVNSLTGTVYFSGIKELQIFGNGVNSLDLRKDPKTLPLGPYKHTNSNYVDAPKMGYRISFDVKTTGKYVTTKDDANKLSNNYKKYVKITPSYYYIKKDGSGYNDKITLYYKNSSNKYVKFIGSGFKISYKPNDGYRNVTNLGITNITNMFTDKYVTLDVSSKDGFNLNIDSMCTNYNGYVQSWYGEFKLPNTTIAVENDDVNKPLTDGYLGVKFDISCFYEYTNNGAKTTKKVSYNTLDKNASGTNTTQWDYEGYLGFKNAGKDVTGNDGLYLQFPKGKLMISSQSLYEQIRGTVVFFDLDNRASNDFE